MTLQLDEDAVSRLRAIDRLPEKQRAEVMQRYQKKTSSDRKIWYCRPSKDAFGKQIYGRRCDGKPHPGAPFKHARSDQWPPYGDDWDYWFFMAGRGTGKTKTGGHWVRLMSKKTDRIALVGRRGTDVRATMVEGPAGLEVACREAGESYDWKPALKEFTFENGAKAFGYSGEEPESLRGPEHGAGWIDEPCHIALIDEVWSNYTLGLRSEGVPGGAKTLLTSSPLPVKWTKERIAEKGEMQVDENGDPLRDENDEIIFDPKTVLVSVPTSVNIDNLDAGYKRRVINPLRGTRKGRQELDAQLLEDVEGALWDADWMKRKRYRRADIDYVVIAVDPAGTNKKKSDATGIVVVGRIGSGDDAKYVVLADYTAKLTPSAWALEVVRQYDRWQANAVVIERYGGDSATTILRQTKRNGQKFTGKIVEEKATVGKKLRAEPISALYEQGLVEHLENADLADLEDEQLTWDPEVTKESPNRVDALVHGLAHCSGRKANRGGGSIASPKGRKLGPPQSHAPGSPYARKVATKGRIR